MFFFMSHKKLPDGTNSYEHGYKTGSSNDCINYVYQFFKDNPYGWIIGGFVIIGGVIYNIFRPRKQEKYEKKPIDKKDLEE